jgi:hypothetical protein
MSIKEKKKMEKSPLTDKTLGIPHNSDNHRFAEVRQKAQDEWTERHIKAKRNRKDPIPKFKIDEEVVLVSGGGWTNERDYILMKVIDF